MNKRTVFACALSFFLAFSSASSQPAARADFILLNGRVFTADDAHPWVEAVAVKDGRIAAVGSTADVRRLAGDGTKVLDVKGRLVIPGFIDAHVHFAAGGKSLASLTFRGVDSIAKVQELVAAKIKELPPGTPIYGSQYDHTLFPGGRWPSKEDLDKVSPGNPVVIERVDGHSLWVNSLALRQSGISRETKNPFGGEILRDPETGEPTGILTEEAGGLLKIKGQPPASTPEEDILRGLAHAASLGLTGVGTSSDLGELTVWKKIEKDGKLTLRAYAWLPVGEMDECIRRGIRQGQGDDFLRTGFLKMFIDGTLGSGTALMLAPFSDEPTKSGLAQYPYPVFAALVDKAYANGFQVGVHAIGDKGVRWVLDAVEAAQKKHGFHDLRPRIEHAQIVDPQDIPRFAALGVIASMQPTHCTTDMRFCEKRIGLERSKNAYAWRTLLEAKARLAFGTDWPVEPLDPMRGLYSAVTRKNIELDAPEGGWFPDQRLTMAEAIKLFTTDAAYASFDEKVKGQLKPGMFGDMVVLSKDLFTIPPKEILKTQAVWTIVGGKVVYARLEAS